MQGRLIELRPPDDEDFARISSWISADSPGAAYTGDVAEDLPVPDQPYTFGGLQAAQAGGDRKALADRGRPLLHLHLTDRAAGIGQLLTALA